MMSILLKKNWVTTKIGDVAIYTQRGKSPRYANHSNLPVINQRCIRSGEVQVEYLKFVHPSLEQSYSQERFLRDGDVLLNSTGTGTLGRAAVFRNISGYEHVVVDSHVTIIRLCEGISPQYVVYFMMSAAARKYFAEVQTGTTNQVELPKKSVEEMEFPLAPEPEQKIIVEKLDILLGRLKKIQEYLEKIPLLIEQHEQSLLRSTFAGETTASWRAKGLQQAHLKVGSFAVNTSKLHAQKYTSNLALPSGWVWGRIGDIVDPERPICYGVVQPGHLQSGGIPMIRVQDISRGKIQVAELRTVAASIDEQFKRSRVQNGDVVISVVGTIGKTAVIRNINGVVNIARAIARIAPVDEVPPDWVCYWIRSSFASTWLNHQSREVARKTLNLSDLAELPIPLAPTEEMVTATSYLDRMFRVADSLWKSVPMYEAQTTALADTILQRAFEGQLTKFSEEYSPASDLLTRSRSQKLENTIVVRSATKARVTRMARLTTDLVKEAIVGMPKTSFSFDDLWSVVAGDYDDLRDVLFSLLGDEDPVIVQYFDEEQASVHFRRA